MKYNRTLVIICRHNEYISGTIDSARYLKSLELGEDCDLTSLQRWSIYE